MKCDDYREDSRTGESYEYDVADPNHFVPLESQGQRCKGMGDHEDVVEVDDRTSFPLTHVSLVKDDCEDERTLATE